MDESQYPVSNRRGVSLANLEAQLMTQKIYSGGGCLSVISMRKKILQRLRQETIAFKFLDLHFSHFSRIEEVKRQVRFASDRKRLPL